MTWMESFLENRSDIEFTGYDILEDNIDNNKQQFSKTNWKFEVFTE